MQVSDEKESLQFMILVHVDEDINAPQQPTSSKNGDSGHAHMRRRPSGISNGGAGGAIDVAAHTSYARRKLEQSVEVSAPPDWGVSKQKNSLTLTILFFLHNAGLR